MEGLNSFFLPLVSVIITNYNYGRFLCDAVGSVRTQTYPHVECIIVDDASSDDSPAILEEIAAKNPSFIIVRHEENVGQTAAFFSGFQVATGQYVVFLDADDILLPDFIETHVFVHLSVRPSVAFTSSDMLQSSGNRVVTSTFGHFANHMRNHGGERVREFRRIDQTSPHLWNLESRFAGRLEASLCPSPPKSSSGFIYAPTSGNCFRSDVLALVLRENALRNMKHHADTFLNRAAYLIGGVVLIDIPLAIYRIHGDNGFWQHPEIWGVLSFDYLKCFRAEHFSWKATTDLFLREKSFFVKKLRPAGYAEVLIALQRSCPHDSRLGEFEPLVDYIANHIRADLAGFQELLGSVTVNSLIFGVHPSGEPTGPRRRLAEACLTIGRAFNSAELLRFGARVWNGG